MYKSGCRSKRCLSIFFMYEKYLIIFKIFIFIKTQSVILKIKKILLLINLYKLNKNIFKS
jgi:hypothetical protein